MSLFGQLMPEFEEDPLFMSPMRNHMRQMNTMMNSFFTNPFGMMGALDNFDAHNALSPFSMPMMPNMNRFMGGSLESFASQGPVYQSSMVVTMQDGRDYYARSSHTTTAPGGVKESMKTVEDSRSGIKKMAIGHQIGKRSHVMKKSLNTRTGDRTEDEDLINLDEDELDDFNHEFKNKMAGHRTRLPASSTRAILYEAPDEPIAGSSDSTIEKSGVPPRRKRKANNWKLNVSPRPALSSTAIVARTPYSPPGQVQSRRNRNIKTVTGSPPPADM